MKNSLKMIEHRGSSNYEYEVFSNAALGTNRLPIVSDITGKQPIKDNSGDVVAILNGEIYNHEELRKDLEKKGYIFKTQTDTEVLVYLYKEYGEFFLDKLDSEIFAFIIYDKKNDTFFVGRDRFGVKPLYYAKDNEANYYFASELKQLTQFDFIKKIRDFPKGCYMKNNVIIPYFKLEVGSNIIDEKKVIHDLSILLENAVKKRVQTEFPIAVLLSGGVDSSLIMELANRYHTDVTGYILGYENSSDYRAAVKLCEEKGYKFKVVEPNENFSSNVEDLIKSLEIFDAQVIRQSFSLDIISEQIKKDGFKIVLSGDLADEVFAGYNEFSHVSKININQCCAELVDSMSSGHNRRLDRLSMKHTLELRSPFFDHQLVTYAMLLNENLKIKEESGVLLTKYILRKVSEKYLPNYISWRLKVPFSNGAGMDVGENYKMEDGNVAKQILYSYSYLIGKSDSTLTSEELIYREIFNHFGYNKLKIYNNKTITKEDLREVDIALNQELINNIVRFFNNKKLFRDSLSNTSSFISILQNTLKNNSSLHVVGFWGASNKNQITNFDLKVIENFNKIKNIFFNKFKIKLEFLFILSDMHASLNGYLKRNYGPYLCNIKLLLEEKSFKALYLSSIWEKHFLNYYDVLNEIKKGNTINFENLNLLERSAKNLGFKNYVYEAKRYYITRILERRILEKEYPNSIFHTFVRKEFRELYPRDSPLVYLWPFKRKKSNVPWFCDKI